MSHPAAAFRREHQSKRVIALSVIGGALIIKGIVGLVG
jgi:hypothetical protein